MRHTINTSNVKPIKLPPRRLPMHKKSIADQERDKMLKANITEPSNSPWAAPIVLVKKRGGITWFSVDFRMLNNVTIKDAYSSHESLDTLSGTKFF